jgi:crossover junction endodeoxyribonuclease RuvC
MQGSPSQARAIGSAGLAQRILGVDPGSLITGWGVVENANGSLRHLGHGAIQTAAGQGQAPRLSCIFQGLEEVLRRYQPQAMSVEKIFFSHNAQSALKLGQARGVVLLAAAENGIPVYEYASTEIKVAVAGYGRAGKQQVLAMVATLLQLSSRLSHDAADALAAAICHLNHQFLPARIAATSRERPNQGAKPWKMS